MRIHNLAGNKVGVVLHRVLYSDPLSVRRIQSGSVARCDFCFLLLKHKVVRFFNLVENGVRRSVDVVDCILNFF